MRSIEALFTKTKGNLLSALVLRPDEWWYLSDLAKHLRVTPSTLQRELLRLTAAGVISRRVDGKRVYYKADSRCPFLVDLQGLFLKTAGLKDVISNALRPFTKKIKVAAIFGSLARGEELSSSDVDLLIVGELNLEDLTPALKKAEASLRREIQTMIYRPVEFRAKIRAKDHFLTTIVGTRMVPIIGSLDDYVEKARN